MPEEPDSLQYDAALAAAMRVVEMFDTSGRTDAIRLGQATFIILESMREVEKRRPAIAGGRLCRT